MKRRTRMVTQACGCGCRWRCGYRRWLALSILILVPIGADVARSQVAADMPDGSRADGGDQGTMEVVDASEYTARSIARVAYMDLRARLEPTPDDYLLAETLLGLAQKYAPDDPQLLRSRIRAAWSAGDTAQVEALTRRLITLDPLDTVAQLRLISSHISGLQTVEERIAAYERLLGPQGTKIDPSIRSRLAIDAAMLAREQNHIEKFEQWLELALQLDSTNKEAAVLAWSYFGPMLKSRSDRLELLLNLLYADPTDPNVYELITSELSHGGAFAQAARFQNLGLSLFERFSPKLDQNLVIESVMIGWQLKGPKAAVESINQQIAAMRGDAASKIAYYEKKRMPTDSLPKPEAIMLAPVYNRIRLVAAISAQDQATIDATLADMQTVFSQTIETAAEADKLSGEQERAERANTMWAGLASQLVALAWADAKPESLAVWSKRAQSVYGPDNSLAITLKAWSDLRNGEPELAVTEFERLGAATNMNLVGKAIALEKVGKKEDAVALLGQLALDFPMSLEGVWARERYRKLTGTDPMATPERAQLAQIADAVPAWIDRMTVDPGNFMTLQCSLENDSILGIEPSRLRIQLRNIAPIPLGVGGDRPINNRLMLAPRLVSGTKTLISQSQPEIVELDQRLRLMPTEAIEANLAIDQGFVGSFVETKATHAVRERWTVLQGYTLNKNGVPSPGALCLQTQSGTLLRAPLAQSRLGVRALISAFDSASVSQLPELLVAVRARMLATPASEFSLASSDRSELAVVAAGRYAHLSAQYRALMLSVLPTSVLVPEMVVFDKVAREEADQSLVPLVLTTRVVDADDPLLERWKAQATGSLGAFVRAFAQRLALPDRTYARLTATDLMLGDDSKIKSSGR